ncbi:MAG: sigma-70 family RNA polymerase sigma factor [Acidobacteriota bacterium]
MIELDSIRIAEDAAQLDTRELVEACIRGDSRAWEILLERYQKLIYSIPIQAGLSRADAAEVFQTVCIKLLRKLSTLRDQSRLTKWIITTTSRESWRLARRRKNDRLIAPPSDPQDSYDLSAIAAALPLPDEEQETLERQQRVRESVEALSERCRRLITLLFLAQEEPSYEEVARQMQMPVASVGPTRARCLEKLRKALDGKI